MRMMKSSAPRCNLPEHSWQRRGVGRATQGSYRERLHASRIRFHLLSRTLTASIPVAQWNPITGGFTMLGFTRLAAAVVALVAALALATATATAAQPVERFHDRYTESFSDVVCGIPVDLEIAATDNFFVYSDWTIKATTAYQVTATNPANGKSLVYSAAGQLREATAPVIDEAAGTITFFPTLKGLQGKFQTAGEGVLMRDAGIIAFADTFDLETGEPLSHEITVVKGPHPEAESDFIRTCEVITAALT